MSPSSKVLSVGFTLEVIEDSCCFEEGIEATLVDWSCCQGVWDSPVGYILQSAHHVGSATGPEVRRFPRVSHLRPCPDHTPVVITGRGSPEEAGSSFLAMEVD